MSAALELRGLVRRFGGLAAVDGVSLALQPGERCALVGPNGAGKTTLIDLVTGVQRPDTGAVILAGVDVTRAPAHRRARAGLARTFQVTRLFPRLTPRESLALALCERRGAGWRPWRDAVREAGAGGEAGSLLRGCGLERWADEPTARLPYGRARMLEIALALAQKPRVLILDEPAAGVPDAERRDILGLLAALPAETCVVLVEHDMDLVFSFASRIVVLAAGRVVADGPPAAIAADPQVQRIYLGLKDEVVAKPAPT
jgi:ABC-type branched-subunit amino acid transport system ATPase component